MAAVHHHHGVTSCKLSLFRRVPSHAEVYRVIRQMAYSQDPEPIVFDK